jgi:hypothetical protein
MALSINVPALTANISVVATNRTNIHNKTGNVCHNQSIFNKMSMNATEH